MVKKESKKENLHTDADLKRYVGAVLEETKSGFKAMGEGHQGIHQRLDRMQEDIDNLTIKVKKVELDVGEINYKLTFNLERKADKNLFVDLDRRVRKLEKA